MNEVTSASVVESVLNATPVPGAAAAGLRRPSPGGEPARCTDRGADPGPGVLATHAGPHPATLAGLAGGARRSRPPPRAAGAGHAAAARRAVGRGHRPTADPGVAAEAAASTLREGQATRWVAEVRVTAGAEDVGLAPMPTPYTEYDPRIRAAAGTVDGTDEPVTRRSPAAACGGDAAARPGGAQRLRPARRLPLGTGRRHLLTGDDRALPTTSTRGSRSPARTASWGRTGPTTRATAASSPTSDPSASGTACAACTGPSASAPVSCTSRPPTPTRTPRSSCSSTRCTTSAPARVWEAQQQPGQCRHVRPAPLPSTTCAQATVWACTSWAPATWRRSPPQRARTTCVGSSTPWLGPALLTGPSPTSACALAAAPGPHGGARRRAHPGHLARRARACPRPPRRGISVVTIDTLPPELVAEHVEARPPGDRDAEGHDTPHASDLAWRLRLLSAPRDARGEGDRRTHRPVGRTRHPRHRAARPRSPVARRPGGEPLMAPSHIGLRVVMAPAALGLTLLPFTVSWRMPGLAAALVVLTVVAVATSPSPSWSSSSGRHSTGPPPPRAGTAAAVARRALRRLAGPARPRDRERGRHLAREGPDPRRACCAGRPGGGRGTGCRAGLGGRGAHREQSLRGEVSMTYVAFAALALLGGAVFLMARPSPASGASPRPARGCAQPGRIRARSGGTRCRAAWRRARPRRGARWSAGRCRGRPRG